MRSSDFFHLGVLKITVLGVVCVGALQAGCSSANSSSRTTITPPDPSTTWSDAPLWYDSPALLVPPGSSNSSAASNKAQRNRLNQERKALAAERAAFEAERAASQPPPPPLSKPRITSPIKDTPQQFPSSQPALPAPAKQ